MAVASSYPNEAVIIDAKRIVDECKLAGHEIEATLNQISGMFVAAMWDTLVSHANYDKISTEPEVQFFRHLRNACGHDGRWNFSKLSHVAQWRDKELTEAHAGQVVFGGLLTQGDVVVLVTDIDKQYFERPPTAKNDA